MNTAKEIYPDYEGGYGPSDYGPMLDSFGPVLLRVDDEDYQGDSRVLYKDGDRYGLLIFGWGSCGGCDALQACDTREEVDALIRELHEKVQWMSGPEMLSYFQTHDWEGDYSYHAEETRRFVKEGTELLLRHNASVQPPAPGDELESTNEAAGRGSAATPS